MISIKSATKLNLTVRLDLLANIQIRGSLIDTIRILIPTNFNNIYDYVANEPLQS